MGTCYECLHKQIMHSFFVCLYNQVLTTAPGCRLFGSVVRAWISVQRVLGSNPARRGSFSPIDYLSLSRLSYRKNNKLLIQKQYWMYKTYRRDSGIPGAKGVR